VEQSNGKQLNEEQVLWDDLSFINLCIIIIIVYYAKVAADTNMYIKFEVFFKQRVEYDTRSVVMNNSDQIM